MFDKPTVMCVEKMIEKFGLEKRKDPSILEATLSIGICECDTTDDFMRVMNKADKALYYVKQRGKNGYYIYHTMEYELEKPNNAVDLDRLVDSIKNVGKYKGAMDIEFREFARTYEYISKLSERYGYKCHFVMITLDTKSWETMDIDEFEQVVSNMESSIRENIRSVDICTRYSSDQFLVILYEAKDENIDLVMQRVFARFRQMKNNMEVEAEYVVRKM